MDDEETADPPAQPTGERRIVVGVEGAESREVLDWAIEEGFRREAVVEAVMVWKDPYASKNWTAPMSASTQPRAIPATRSSQLTRLVDEASRRYPGARVEAYLRDGRPAPALLRAAAGADLLVIGSTTTTGVVGALSRSVGRQVLAHAPCPVVVVPPRPPHRPSVAAQATPGTAP